MTTKTTRTTRTIKTKAKGRAVRATKTPTRKPTKGKTKSQKGRSGRGSRSAAAVPVPLQAPSTAPPPPSPTPASNQVSDYLQRKAGANMYELLGGKQHILSILEDSTHPKARQLIDRLQSSAYQGENFSSAYSSVGMKAHEMVEIFSNVQQARVLIHAITQADDVMRSLIRAASDQLELHEKCGGTGKVVDRRTSQPTDEDCLKCRGTGYLLLSGERQAQELYFEMIQWRKAGGLVNIDARRQSVSFGVGAGAGNGGGAGMLGGTLPGQAPDVNQIIKRADTLALPPMQVTQQEGELVNDHQMSDQLSGTGDPDDMALEPELVGEE